MGGGSRRDAADTIPEHLILADTSAWIEFLRSSEHPADRTLTRLVDQEAAVGVTGPVIMEVLAGLRERDVPEAREMLLSLPLLPIAGLADFEEATGLYRRCRAGGETVRKLLDCLIAAVAIREEVPLLHNDMDFDVIARHT
ncbi:MAG: type II toxin-antitoxin system VapC family toxin, partial [Actinomycetota bacterium]